MSTGLFSNRKHAQGLNFRTRRNQHRRRDLAPFAEAIANGATLAEAGRNIGVSGQRASQLFAKMRRDLGWQAQ